MGSISPNPSSQRSKPKALLSNKNKKKGLLILITLGALGAGFFFYRFNSGDTVNTLFFTFGIMGIVMSFARNAH